MKYYGYISILLIMMFLIGCSGSSNPIEGIDAPLNESEPIAEFDRGFLSDDDQIILGAFQITRDPITHELDIVPYYGREALGHFNINRFLERPYCPVERCWQYELMDYDPWSKIYHFDMMIYNPTPWDVYDVRVLFIELYDTDEMDGELYTDNDITILNADGWTKILKDEDAKVDMNPYILFNREQVPTPIRPNPERKFGRYTFDVERLVMHWPVDHTPGYENINGPIFLLAASYPGQAEEPLQYLWIEQIPPMNPSELGFSYITTGIFTHHPDGEHPDTRVFFSCPDIIGLDDDDEPLEIELERWYRNGDREFLGWIARIDNLEEYSLVGKVPAMLRASAPNPGDYDTYYKFDFKLRRNPGGSGQTDYDAPIAFTSYLTGNAEVNIASNVFMHGRQNISQSPDSSEIDPHWVKQSSTDWYLYYSSNAGESRSIYVQKFNRVGNEFIKLGDPIKMTGGMEGDQRMPYVSQDRTFMVFASTNPDTGDSWDIFRGDLPTVGDLTYFNHIANLTNSPSNERNPTVDAFSNYILFDSDYAGANRKDILGMVPTYGSRIDIIFQSPENDSEPSFNPKAPNYFAFTREVDGGKPNIWRAEMSGYEVIDILNLTWDMEDSNQRLATWSPSGQQIMFQSDRGTEYTYELWIMDFDGFPRDRITYNDYDDIYPNWGPIP